MLSCVAQLGGIFLERQNRIVKNETVEFVQGELRRLSDESYANFSARLMPSVPRERVLGVRTPVLRRFAKEFSKDEKCEIFLHALPHYYHEENNLHAFLIEKIRDFDKCIDALRVFLPYIDNWASCDSMVPSCFKGKAQELLDFADELLASKHTYSVRYGIGILMRFFLDEEFSPDILTRVAKIHTNEYYIRMMQAWFFQAAIVKQYDSAIPYFEERQLDKWVHLKAISKCSDSYRIPKETKDYLKTMR